MTHTILHLQKTIGFPLLSPPTAITSRDGKSPACYNEELEDGEFLFKAGDFPFLLLVIALGETQWFSGNLNRQILYFFLRIFVN